MTTTSTFTDLGDGRTEVRIHQINVPEAMLAARGAGRLLDLARPVRRLPRDPRREGDRHEDHYSADGTKIAYEKQGDGPALILIDGAMCTRNTAPSRSWPACSRRRCTVYVYDRRGRGDSGDTSPYAVEREIGTSRR